MFLAIFNKLVAKAENLLNNKYAAHEIRVVIGKIMHKLVLNGNDTYLALYFYTLIYQHVKDWLTSKNILLRNINMGMQVSIDINFAQEYSPKEILKCLINSGWNIYYQNMVTYLSSNDIDDYNWLNIDMSLFNLDEFINSHNVMDKVGIVMVYDNESGGNLLIYPNYLSMSLSINRQYLFGEDIPDFNWYLKKMGVFLRKIKLSSIQCETIY